MVTNSEFKKIFHIRVVTIFLVIVMVISCAPEPVFDSVAEVKRGDVSVMISATGNVVFDRDQKLHFGISGEIAEVWVDEGEIVTEGQELAILEPNATELKLLKAQTRQKLAEEELNKLLSAPEAHEIELVNARVQNAIDTLELAEIELNDVKPAADKLVEDSLLLLEDLKENHSLLYRKFYGLEVDGATLSQNPKEVLQDFKNPVPLNTWTRSFPQNEQLALDTIESDLQTSWSELRQAELNYSAALIKRSRDLINAAKKVTSSRKEMHIKQEEKEKLESPPEISQILAKEVSLLEAEIAVAQVEQDSKRLILRAPFAGTIVDLNISKGDMINQSSKVMRLVTASSLHVIAYLDESDLLSVRNGQFVAISPVSDSAELMEGVVADTERPYIMDSGSVRYPVEVSIQPDIDSAVKAGMKVLISVETSFKSNVIVVPVGALKRSGIRYSVDVVADDGITDSKLVNVGAMDSFNAEITRGLVEGQIVVNRSVVVGRSEFLEKERTLRNNAE